MKKRLQIFLKHNSKIIIDTIVKSTHETNIKVHDFFEQDTPCLILSIEHDQLNTLLDLTKTRPYTLIYLDNGCGGYIFAAAAFSNNETEIPFSINTQFKKILFIPSSIGVSPMDIEKNTIMEFVENNEIENSHQHNVFLSGYGKFPYIILKTEGAIYTQIPIYFNGFYEAGNVMLGIEKVSDELLADYDKDKTSELHDIIIKHCQWYIPKIEADKKRDARICLVEGPEIAYYFDGGEINFSNSIPTGGILLTLQNKILTMNTDHYLESANQYSLIMNWSEYGKWRHPKEWWQNKLIQWIESVHKDKLKRNPKIVEVRETDIVFGMKKHYGRLVISKKTLLKYNDSPNR
jgi:hypothetical protein